MSRRHIGENFVEDVVNGGARAGLKENDVSSSE